jgi:hypothetical protein
MYGIHNKSPADEEVMGTPIYAFSGNMVYWEVQEDLPRSTKLMIDGIALYTFIVQASRLSTSPCWTDQKLPRYLRSFLMPI